VELSWPSGGKRLDNAALGYRSTGALIDDLSQLAAERLKIRDLVFDLLKVFAGERIDGRRSLDPVYRPNRATRGFPRW
jgi:hypothetical protein